MTAIAFPHASGAWSASERELLLPVCEMTSGGRTWEIGVTESGDPQLYLIGAPPEQACDLCVSRVGGRYVLEDGTGRLLAANRNLDVVVMHAKNALREPRNWLVARIVLLWFTVRHAVHDRVEPVLAESEELLVHVAPQLAVFA